MDKKMICITLFYVANIN